MFSNKTPDCGGMFDNVPKKKPLKLDQQDLNELSELQEVLEEDDKISGEDLILASFGIQPNLVKGFRKRYSDKKVLYQEKPTRFFFKWYLDCCDKEMLRAVVKEKLSNGLLEVFGEAKPISEEDQTLVSKYIDTNAQLYTETQQAKKMFTEVISLNQELLENIKFLLSIVKKYKLTEEEIKKIKQINEVI